jgi:iron complex transport system permease protein
MTSPTPAPRVTNAHDWAHKRTPDVRRPWWRRALPLTIAIVLTLALCVASVLIGVADLRSEEGRGIEFLWLTRIPRTAALVLAGASLALAGLVMQLMTQNRFVEPSTVGTTEWAGLGLLLTYAFWPTASVMLKMAVAIVFAFIGTMIFFTFLRRVTLKSSLIVPIVGIMFGAVIVAVVAIVIFIIADRFTVAGLGKEVATNVGLNYERIVLLGVGLVSVVTGVVTVVIGNLPFIGLIVPNLVSMIRGDNLRTNIPWVFLAGIWVVMVCDIIGRVVIMPFEVPVSVVLGVVGAVVFITMLLSQRKPSNV